MPGDMPMGRFAMRPRSRQAMVEERAVAVTTAGIGRPDATWRWEVRKKQKFEGGASVSGPGFG